MVNYNDFAKYWADQGGANAVAEGWGAADPNAELRRRFGIPDSISDQQIQNYYSANGLPDPKAAGGIGEFISPLAFIGASAIGGPVGGSIAAANGSGATQSLGIDPKLTTLGALAYGAANGSTPGDIASSDGGAMDMGQGMNGMYDYQSPQNGSFWNNSYAANNTGTMTDALPAGGNGMDDWWSELGLTAQDVGMSADPWTTSPSTADLGGNIGSSGGLTDFLSQAGSDTLKFLGKNPGLVGAGLGALLGAKSGSRPAGNVTTTQGPPDWLMPYINSNLGAGQGVLAGMQSNQPLLNAAQGEAHKTISGAYLDPSSNPYLAKSANDALGLAKSHFNSMYTGAFGDANNANMQEGLARNLGNTALPFYMNNYNAERGRQIGTAMGAPAMSAQSSEAAFSPIKAFSGLFPNASATTQPYFNNPMGGALSGGLFGGALGRAFG